MPAPVPAPVYAPDGTPLSYIIVIDAGSKGTRAYLYAYSPSTPAKLVNLPHWHKRMHPSIESIVIANGLNYRHVSAYLNRLLFNINAIIPPSQHYRTPIFFHSTAGFRLLEPDIQTQLLNHVCTYFSENTNYFIPHCDSHVSVISGEVEGLYSWVTLNYLLSSSSSSSKSKQSTPKPFLLQLGGGSAQLVYQTNHPIHSFNGLTLYLPDENPINLFSNSYQGFGLNQIRQEYLQSLVQTNPNSLLDPCLPLDYTSEISITDKQYTFTGSADYNSCTNLIYDQITANLDSCSPYKPFQLSQCMVPSYAEYTASENSTFYAISGYAKVINAISALFNIDLSTPQSRSIIQPLTQQLCSSSLDQLHEMPNIDNFDQNKIAYLCFSSIYVQALLQTGFNISLDSPSLHFNDTFNGTKFSWTLGRALLYALDDDANNITDYHYGFSSNIKPNAFVNGAEQKEIPSRPQFQPDHPYDPTPLQETPNFNPDETEIFISNPFPWTPLILFLSLLATILAIAKVPYLRRRVYNLYNRRANVIRCIPKHNDSNIELAFLQPTNSSTAPDSDFDLEIEPDWDNDSDGIERAV